MNRLLNESKKDDDTNAAASKHSKDTFITLVMRSKSPHLLSVMIKCTIGLEIHDLAQTYSSSQNVSIYNLRFYYNNRRLRIANEHTVKSLNMKEGDEIQVVYVTDF
jgi:hypothetical protein